jgi:hypothetical protein
MSFDLRGCGEQLDVAAEGEIRIADFGLRSNAPVVVGRLAIRLRHG